MVSILTPYIISQSSHSVDGHLSFVLNERHMTMQQWLPLFKDSSVCLHTFMSVLLDYTRLRLLK